MALSGIYFHIPFCSKACAYCDFHFSTSLKLKSEVLSAMKAELEHRLAHCNWQSIQSIYFGGGTPSLLNASEIDDLLKPIWKRFGKEIQEFTLEANPDDLSPEKLHALRKIGVNRLSIGIQSFFQEDLEWMNRSHNAEQAEQCLRDAKQAGFKSFNTDLIFGYPLLSDAKLHQNLEKMIAFGVNHLSTYSMTVEPGTALDFAIREKGQEAMEEGQAENQYRYIMKFLKERGWNHYEVSNFCKVGNPSLHNSSYWSGRPYLGIGPSAHGYDGKERYWNVANNAAYVRQMNDNILPEERESLRPSDQYNEFLMTRLRTSGGISRDEMGQFFRPQMFDDLKKQLEQAEMEKYFVLSKDLVHMNEEGFLIADHLISELFIVPEDKF